MIQRDAAGPGTINVSPGSCKIVDLYPFARPRQGPVFLFSSQLPNLRYPFFSRLVLSVRLT